MITVHAPTTAALNTTWQNAPTHTIKAGGVEFAYPQLVRKMIIAGTGPAGGEGIDKVTRITYLDTARGLLTRQDPKQLLFFTSTPNGRRAGKEFLARLEERTNDRDKAISVRSFRAQLRAIHRWGQQKPADLASIHQPVLLVTATRWCLPGTPSTSADDSPTANSSSIPTPATAACSSSTRTSSSGLSSSSEGNGHEGIRRRAVRQGRTARRRGTRA
jgi:hypothetical protein